MIYTRTHNSLFPTRLSFFCHVASFDFYFPILRIFIFFCFLSLLISLHLCLCSQFCFNILGLFLRFCTFLVFYQCFRISFFKKYLPFAIPSFVFLRLLFFFSGVIILHFTYNCFLFWFILLLQ